MTTIPLFRCRHGILYGCPVWNCHSRKARIELDRYVFSDGIAHRSHWQMNLCCDWTSSTSLDRFQLNDLNVRIKSLQMSIKNSVSKNLIPTSLISFFYSNMWFKLDEVNKIIGTWFYVYRTFFQWKRSINHKNLIWNYDSFNSMHRKFMWQSFFILISI